MVIVSDAMKAVQYPVKCFHRLLLPRFEVDQNCNAEDNLGGGMRSAVAVYSKEGRNTPPENTGKRRSACPEMAEQA